MPTLEQTRRARGLVSSRVSGSRVDAATRPPPPDLAGLVACFWVGRWDLPVDAPHTTQMLGDPSVHICFERSGPDVVSKRVVGVWTRLWERTLAGVGYVHAMKLRPGAAGALVADASALSDRLIPIEAALGPADDPRLLDPDDDVAFDALATFARRHLHARPDTAQAIDACARVAADPGLLRAEALADAEGLSLRSLQRLFRLNVGASPKFVIRRHRLQEVAARLERGGAADLSELAFTLGYADHAHLTRDFRAAVGKPPSAFARAVWT